ncbi:MAG: signal peptidase I [Candidatus Aminicenantes bacterium]|nr:signal peptidase I [Candidatus Aminicenantes bacterium]
MEEKKDKFRERKPLFAVALSFLLTGLGQVYNGKLRKGILFFLASFILPFLFFQLSVLWPGQILMVFLVLSLAASLGIFIWAARDAWKQARRMEKNYRLKVYNRLSVYVLLIIVLNLFASGLMVNGRKICFFALPYRMQTGSMAPALLPGDWIMADKRIDHASKNLGLKRGELVVFKYPRNKKIYFIKRVVGLPGDEIELRGMELYVNGKKWTSQEVPQLEGRGDENIKKGTIAFYEKGDSGNYIVFYLQGAERQDLSVSVPEGCCFVLGDNRDNSADSRHWGNVPLDDIVSRARLVYFSIAPEGGVRWGRIGKVL